MTNSKNIYFASDFHLGAPDYESSRERERLIVSWLDEIKDNCGELFLVGDLFDFWFEYKKAIPKGFVRLQGKIAEFTDEGIPVHVFTGNHDMWMFDYLPQELGIKLYKKPIHREFSGKKFMIGHGDGLGPGDHGYKFIKKVFANPLSQWLFARLHPNLGISMADYWSGKSRRANRAEDEKFLGEENEWLAIYCKEYLKKEHIDYFIFGHRHLPLDIKLDKDSRYVNLGEWMNYQTYAVFDGEKLELKEFSK
ncbi:MAG: UDP-2,3-diacylglucosamine hydrolase [Flavobacteriales bacterium]|nr:UDP-2,3-diacylglucosamine hydrolase [Flavobacteriales bacterium]